MAIKKTGLGRGLSALINDKAVVENILSEENKDNNDRIENININEVYPKEGQPRKYFNDEALKELAESIKLNGIIQPIVVRKIDKGYEIVAGERRYRASKLLGLKEIPCIVKAIDDITSSKISLIENVQRENLNPIEEANAYKSLMEEYSLKQDELGDAVGKSRTYISNILRLLKLNEKVIEYIYEGKITIGHGKALLGIKDEEEQLKAAERIVNIGLNVRDTEEEVKNIKEKAGKKSKLVKPREPYIVDLEENLMRTLGTKVNLQLGRKKGKIEIEYYSPEDLDRIIELLSSIG